MRCETCGKFVGYGEPRTDEIEVEVDDDGTIRLSGTLYLTCENCGLDLKSCEVDDQTDASMEFSDVENDKDVTFELGDDADISPTDRSAARVRYFGVSADVCVMMRMGDECHYRTVTVATEERASAFEDC